jgi:hypothetical protein
MFEVAESHLLLHHKRVFLGTSGSIPLHQTPKGGVHRWATTLTGSGVSYRAELYPIVGLLSRHAPLSLAMKQTSHPVFWGCVKG